MLDEILYCQLPPSILLFPSTSPIGNREKAGFIITEVTLVFYSAIDKLDLLNY